VAHVLSGGVLGSRRRHQPSLAVDYIGHESRETDLLQAPDKVIHVHHRPDHAEKTSAVDDWRTDQHYRAGGLSTAHHKRLTTIDASFVRRLVGPFQLALQKCVRLNATG
jgi:hypothetical protein